MILSLIKHGTLLTAITLSSAALAQSGNWGGPGSGGDSRYDNSYNHSGYQQSYGPDAVGPGEEPSYGYNDDQPNGPGYAPGWSQPNGYGPNAYRLSRENNQTNDSGVPRQYKRHDGSSGGNAGTSAAANAGGGASGVGGGAGGAAPAGGPSAGGATSGVGGGAGGAAPAGAAK